ncbi:mechanosensitive ion channel family protein [Cyanobium sp. NS01]|jgi:small conductance mechanosensitive channel|uniref:mechanosensitive ion channel family protein n=1 Tax=Cyanobium sp. NS01 TaxID=261284 RepID=UPI001647B46F|nr:mechanosensitive ion channel domain-containing protein [Cyanobium sp. NS01]QNI69694.1 small-conductance mechanosensitive ion channel/ MscS family [Cyanobium sp. NS01]
MQQVLENIRQWLSLAQEVGVELGLNLLAALAIFVIGRWLAKLISRIVKRSLTRNPRIDSILVGFLTTFTYYALLAFVVIAALNRLGIQTTSIIAVVGAAGLAIGLALQGSLSNFAAGVLMVFFRPFQIGDFIEGAGTMGTVKELTLFTTTLQSPDNKIVIIPNSKLNSDNITNFNALGRRRLDFVFGVSYQADIDIVKALLADEVKTYGRFLVDPEPVIGVLELADSSVNFAVRPWVNVDDYWPAFFGFQEQVKKRLDSEGIAIPFPQRDVHLIGTN